MGPVPAVLQNLPADIQRADIRRTEQGSIDWSQYPPMPYDFPPQNSADPVSDTSQDSLTKNVAVIKTVAKNYVISSLIIMAVSALASNYLMPHIDTISGVALTGFSLLLVMPLYIGWKIRNAQITDIAKKDTLPDNSSPFLKKILIITSLCSAIALSILIMRSISALPEMSYLEAFKLAGLQFGLITAATCGIKYIKSFHLCYSSPKV